MPLSEYATFSLSIHWIKKSLRLIPYFGYFEWCWNKHGCIVPILSVDLHSFRYIPRGGIAGSDDSSSLSILRNLHADFISGCTNLHSYLQCIRISPPSSLPASSLAFVSFLDVSHSDWLRWNGISVLLWFTFPLRLRIWTFLHVFISHLYFFFWKLSSHLPIY
jgi:hypothetical protein